ncbi:MAG: hypothetical protein ACXVC6_01665 [Bacteroidia bacterium]
MAEEEQKCRYTFDEATELKCFFLLISVCHKPNRTIHYAYPAKDGIELEIIDG